MPTELEKERDNIDGHLTTATITLIAGFFVLFSITKFNSKLAFWSAIVSLCLFILTLLFNLWYRYRKAMKKELLDKKLNDCLEKEIEVFTTYGELIKPIAEQKFLEIYSGALPEKMEGKIADIQKNLGRKDLDERFDAELKSTMDKNKPILKSIVENLMNKILKIHSETVKKPLPEKFSRIKFYLDILSFRTRYFLFISGLILFIISLIFNNIDIQ